MLRPLEIDALCSRLSKAAEVLKSAMQEDSNKTFEQGRRFLKPNEWDQYKDQIHVNLLVQDVNRWSTGTTYYSRYMKAFDDIHRKAQAAKAS